MLNRFRRPWRNASGFTLIELMIVVAIIGVLAAVAIPVMSGYVRRSKAAEAFTMLQGIREKQEAYFGEYRRYTQNLPPFPAPAAACDVCRNETVAWDFGQPGGDLWLQLGFAPDGPTYYTYWLEGSYGNGDIFQAGIARTDNLGTTWGAVVKPWYMVYACGDLDCNGVASNYYISSENKAIYSPEYSEFSNY